MASLPLVVASALAAGDAQAQSAAPAKAKTSQSSKTAAKPAKTSAATKAASRTAQAARATAAAGKAALQGKTARNAGKRLQTGTASWYGPGFHGRKTANGERFDMYELTAAHRTLPLGSRVRVVNPDNGKEVVVRINDRGPYAHGRILDLSKAAASKLGLIQRGHGDVVLHALGDDAVGDGLGLSTTRVAANSDGVSIAQAQQAQVLARTRFGESKQVLGVEPEAVVASLPEPVAELDLKAQLARVALPQDSPSVVGLVASPAGLGFDVARTGSVLPWGRSEWDRTPILQANAMANVVAPAEAAPSAVSGDATLSASDVTAVAAAPGASAALAAATVSVVGASALPEGASPTHSRLAVPAVFVLPVHHLPEATAQPDVSGGNSAHELTD